MSVDEGLTWASMLVGHNGPQLNLLNPWSPRRLDLPSHNNMLEPNALARRQHALRGGQQFLAKELLTAQLRTPRLRQQPAHGGGAHGLKAPLHEVFVHAAGRGDAQLPEAAQTEVLLHLLQPKEGGE